MGMTVYRKIDTEAADIRYDSIYQYLINFLSKLTIKQSITDANTMNCNNFLPKM